jgi:hypothetical protein
MAAGISFELGQELPLWADFFLYPDKYGIDLQFEEGKEKWVVITVPTRSHISVLLALGQIASKINQPASHHRQYGLSELSSLKPDERITWLDKDKKFLHFGHVLDANYGPHAHLLYKYEAKNKQDRIQRDKEMAMNFRFDRYFGEIAKDSRPLADPSPGAEILFNLSNLEIQCRTANYVHVVGVISHLSLEAQTKVFVDEYSTSLESLLRPDHLFSTGHYLSRWTSPSEEDESIIENSEITIFDGPSAFFRNRNVASPVNVVVVDRWENRAFAVVEEIRNFAAMYGGLAISAPSGLAIEFATFARSR